MQQTLKNLANTFQGFFKGKNGYPVFKKKYQHDCLHFPQGFKLFRSNLGKENEIFQKGIGKVFLPKIGYVESFILFNIVIFLPILQSKMFISEEKQINGLFLFREKWKSILKEMILLKPLL